MVAKIDAVDEAGVTLDKYPARLGLGGWKPPAFPDLVQPAWIATIARTKVATANAQPACDPDIDGVSFSQRTRPVVRAGKWGCADWWQGNMGYSSKT